MEALQPSIGLPFIAKHYLQCPGGHAVNPTQSRLKIPGDVNSIINSYFLKIID